MKLPRLLLPASRDLHIFTCGILAVLALICPLSEKAHAAAYTFTNIADATGIYAKSMNNQSGIGTGRLSLNNAGTVAFNSFLDDGGTGVFAGNGGPVQNIARSSGPIFSAVGGASINDSGTVAFVGILESGVLGVFTSQGGPLTTVALVTEPGFSNLLAPVINNSGTVAFTTGFSDGSYGILSRTGGVTTPIALESGPIFSGVGGNLAINSTGRVAFRGILENGQRGIFTSNGGVPTTIVLGNILTDGASINDSGSVAYIFGGVNVGNGSGTTSISGNFTGAGQYAAINNLGQVAFIGGLSGGSGIFTGSGPIAEQVIRTGDILFGDVVTKFSLFPIPTNEIFGNVDINDSGQIAFHYELAGGLQGIAVATPVPEPGIALTLAMGGMLLLLLVPKPCLGTRSNCCLPVVDMGVP